MRILSGIPIMVFIVWAVIAMPHAAYGETYEDLQAQIEDQQTRIFEQQQQIENDATDQDLRAYDRGCTPTEYDGEEQ